MTKPDKRARAPQSAKILPMQAYSMADLKIGMRVVFVDSSLNVAPSSHVDAPLESNEEALRGRLGLVVALNAGPGKQVGVCFQTPVAGGHSCDMPAVPAGHGYWVLPEHLYSEAGYQAHEEAATAADDHQAKVRGMLKDFLPK